MQRLIAAAMVTALLAAPLAADDPTVQELLDGVGMPPANGQRGQMDTVGFVTTAAQMDSVVAQATRLAGDVPDDEPLVAAVCPHDDYYYAARLYARVIPRIRAHTVILFGVFHKARVFFPAPGSRDRIVFDDFERWHGPYAPVAVSPLRAELIARLSPQSYVVDNDMHTVEHSIEAIVPWLQATHRDVEIVPVLVPYMDWNTMDRLAGEFATALAAVMRERGLKLGEDVALIASADAVHYGDAGWGGSSYADFGTDAAGYERAVQRDIDLARRTLCGAVTTGGLRDFLTTCVAPNDVTRYKLTWCGRFSVPFGINVATRVTAQLDGGSLQGTLLGYGTSVEEVSLDLDAIPGLGTTAPNNLHHWVGYAAVGYERGAGGE
jgi:AmmeMemoRadiSam system protein B